MTDTSKPLERGNLTTLLRKLQQASYVEITKEFQGSKPRTWVQSTANGRRAFAEYLSNLERALKFRPQQRPSDHQGESHTNQPG